MNKVEICKFSSANQNKLFINKANKFRSLISRQVSLLLILRDNAIN